MRIYYSLTTLDPVIVSQNNATTNNHLCLDYVPGSAILGALASKLYPTLNEKTSWEMFHSGLVKFGPCYPIKNNQLALPIPASWHFQKGQNAFSDGKLNNSAIENHANANYQRQQGVQYKQCRDGYITPTSHAANTNKAIAVKTAVERSTGIAKEGSLFSYSYIDSKQTFIGWIESDNSEYLNNICTVLNEQLSIGRSRNTEFGRVKINILPEYSQTTPAINTQWLTIWCLSDCQCINAHGLPTFSPNLTELITDAKGTLNLEKSFIRTTKVSRFNQKRKGYDSEQLLISKGSVLVYKLTTPLTQLQINDLQHQGIGINCQQGLGWIMVNPDWSQQTNALANNPLFNTIELVQAKEVSFSNKPNSPLTLWIESKLNQDTLKRDANDKVNRLLALIGQAYRNARQYNNILNSHQAGPSKNQWRRITDELKNNNNKLQEVLFDENKGICKANNDELGWGITWNNGQGLIIFADFIQQTLIQEQLSNSTFLILLNKINRYDFSTYKGLKTAAQELNFKLVAEQASSQEITQ